VEQVKGQLWSHWLPKCIDVYRRLPPVAINDVKAYFRRVSFVITVRMRTGWWMQQ
jgi:hypothetical protein